MAITAQARDVAEKRLAEISQFLRAAASPLTLREGERCRVLAIELRGMARSLLGGTATLIPAPDQAIREDCAAKVFGTCRTMAKGYAVEGNEVTSTGISNAGVYAVSSILGISLAAAIDWCRARNAE